MNKLDLGNTIFECGGAVLTWLNYAKLWRDREIKGVDWRVTAFWSVWGIWNLFYYPALGQWFSAAAGLALVLGNIAWCVLALKIVTDQDLAKAEALVAEVAAWPPHKGLLAQEPVLHTPRNTEPEATPWRTECGHEPTFSDSGALSLSTFIAPPSPPLGHAHREGFEPFDPGCGACRAGDRP